MKRLLAFLSILVAQKAQSQICDCLSQFKYVQAYYEKNNPAFQKIISNKRNLKLYKGGVNKIISEIRLKSNGNDCPDYLYFEKYVTLLKDHHSGIEYKLKQRDFSTDSLLINFKKSEAYKEWPKINIDTNRLKEQLSKKKLQELEGIYTNGGNLLFGVVRKESTKNEYIGVVLRKTKLLEIGHIILEFKCVKKNLYDCNYNIGLLGFNSRQVYKQITITNGQITDFGFTKIEKKIEKSEFEFKVLDDKTNYLRLSSFDGSLTQELDSFYRSLDKQLKAKPYLIIDLRDNSGGSEQSYFGLMPYIYTKPMKVDSVVVWVTPDNIAHYEKIFGETNPALIKRMKAAKPFSFIPQIEGATGVWTMDSAVNFPQKVALIYNRGTASAAEGMITYCLQSSKVITLGENSGGYMGYGDVITAPTPCGNIALRSTSTMYHSNAQYEFIGIKPKYSAAGKRNWVAYAKTVLMKAK